MFPPRPVGLLVVAIALGACAPAAPPTAIAPSTAAATMGACGVEGFNVDAEERAAYYGPAPGGMAMRRVFHEGEAGAPMPTGTPSGDIRCVALQSLAAPLSTMSASGLARFVLESARGPLTADAADNEGFLVRLFDDDGTPILGAAVTLECRMPHHNRTNPRGHGPANDLAASGLGAVPQPDGAYTVETVDFSMAGPWLVTARAVIGTRTEKAHWAVMVQ